MLYRSLLAEQASHIMNFCEINSIEYDVWNAGAVWCGDAETVELGLEPGDWDKVYEIFDKAKI